MDPSRSASHYKFELRLQPLKLDCREHIKNSGLRVRPPPFLWPVSAANVDDLDLVHSVISPVGYGKLPDHFNLNLPLIFILFSIVPGLRWIVHE